MFRFIVIACLLLESLSFPNLVAGPTPSPMSDPFAPSILGNDVYGPFSLDRFNTGYSNLKRIQVKKLEAHLKFVFNIVLDEVLKSLQGFEQIQRVINEFARRVSDSPHARIEFDNSLKGWLRNEVFESSGVDLYFIHDPKSGSIKVKMEAKDSAVLKSWMKLQGNVFVPFHWLTDSTPDTDYSETWDSGGGETLRIGRTQAFFGDPHPSVGEPIKGDLVPDLDRKILTIRFLGRESMTVGVDLNPLKLTLARFGSKGLTYVPLVTFLEEVEPVYQVKDGQNNIRASLKFVSNRSPKFSNVAIVFQVDDDIVTASDWELVRDEADPNFGKIRATFREEEVFIDLIDSRTIRIYAEGEDPISMLRKQD